MFADNIPIAEWRRQQVQKPKPKPVEQGRNGSPKRDVIDRLPPHSPDAEAAVLGCCLLSPRSSIGQCVENFKDGPRVFYDLRHQTIYTALVEMFDKAESIDAITLLERLKEKGKLDEIGGLVYLSKLSDAVNTDANLEYYLKIVGEKHTLRRMIQTCMESVTRIYDYEGEVDVLLDEFERDVLRIRESRVTSQIVPIKELVQGSLTRFEASFSKSGSLTGISTGFSDIDKMMDGLKPSNVVVLAARPGFGKTSLALNIADYIGSEMKLPVGFFSLEMTADELSDRLITSKARVNMRNIREGFMSERDFPKLATAAGKISASTLYIDDTGALSILQLRARARRYYQQFGIKVFMIDYLQLMNAIGGHRRPESRQQEVADISCGIKALAKELKVAILALCQLNRNSERDKDRKPQLSDLRESGAIEQDADTVMLMYKPKSGNDDDDEEQDARPVNLLFAKNRNGPTGDVNLTFFKSYTRFESAAKISDDRVPPEIGDR